MHHTTVRDVEPTCGTTWALPAPLREKPRLARLLHHLMGPRFVDLPIRVLTLIFGLSAMTTLEAQSNDPLRLALSYVSCALVILSAFVPKSAGIVALMFIPVFTLSHPSVENPFLLPVEFAGMMLLSMLRWRWWLLLLTLEIGLVTLTAGTGNTGTIAIGGLVFAWALNAPYALAACLLESRIQREIARREHTARENERAIHNLRLRFATDAHDTVSHGLASQAAILRMIEHSAVSEEVRHRIEALSEINTETQQQLRTLLSRLSAAEDPNTALSMPVEELRRAIESMGATSAAGGVDISIRIKNLPKTIPAELGVHVMFTAQELVTNLVKHSVPEGNRQLSLSYRSDEAQDWLLLESRNTAKLRRNTTPRTLSHRAHELGGSCRVEFEGLTRKTIIQLPVSRAVTGAPA